MEVILLRGGPCLSQCIALNVSGPQIHTAYGWRAHNTCNALQTEPGISQHNFICHKDIFEKVLARKKKNIPHIPVPLADEPARVGTIHYVADQDELFGIVVQWAKASSVLTILKSVLEMVKLWV